MFDDHDDAGLVDAMGVASRAESVGVARRLLLVGELYARRAREWAERALWCTDPFEAVAAEISAAQNISRARAGGQIRFGRTLREELPAVAAVFATGAIDFRLVSVIIARTENVDQSVKAGLDAALAAHAIKWMKLSGPKLRDRLDLWVAKFDPAGVRVPPSIDENRYVEIDSTSMGMAGIWANVHALDAAALDKRLNALAATVCESDPRTNSQRRADAIGALAAGAQHLGCGCGSPDCPAANGCPPAGGVVIHVLAEQATVAGTGQTPGYLPGFGVLPAEAVRNSTKYAKLVPLTVPTQAEPGYRPSTALTRFVRWRDLTCRFPGCDAPPEACDVDHTVPHPRGATHASNNKLYCRTHHLLKTFYIGLGGWAERQFDNGTVVLTAPTGHTYPTYPHGGALFPALGQSTGRVPTPPDDTPPRPGRSLAMPTRTRTRDQDRQARIVAERRERTELIAEQNRQRRAWHVANYEPPPF
jgi:hypothetical protein